MKEMSLCPYCKGALFINAGYIEKITAGKKSLYPYARPCYCEINRQIGMKFPLLGVLPDIPPEDASAVHQKYLNKNMLFFGDEPKYLYLIKSFFMNNWHSNDYMMLEGTEIVQKYHVPKRDGTWLTIDILNQYDLLALYFTSHTKYETLQNCVLDVVKNRLRLQKSTWIYARDDAGLRNSKEFSSELEQYLEHYRKENINQNFKYKGYVEDEDVRKLKMRQRNINDDLGSLDV